MNGTDDSYRDVLIGVNLTSEAFLRDRSQDVCLGTVLVSATCHTLAELRNYMCVQLPTLPVSFTFLTKQGWPIAKGQEANLQVSQVLCDNHTIRIQRCYEKPRVGVKTLEGVAVGFVFVDHNCSVNVLRNIIQRQLGYLEVWDGGSFRFVDRNGWPVGLQQENCLTVLDVLVDGAVRLCPQVFTPCCCAIEAPDTPDAAIEEPEAKRKKFTGLRQLTFRTSKDQERPSSSSTPGDSIEHKQILISYVRAEAAQHALVLKEELIEQGFSVYLDVHEIKSGIDWQDALNFAVSHCEVFVPLVTPRYGETQWTNREVKLADVLGKLIVPVSYLDHWPPECLAIQFATTQYVPWKSPDAIQNEQESDTPEHATDIRFWDRPYVNIVAKQIAERVRAHYEQLPYPSKVPLVKRHSNLRSYAATLPEGLADLSQVSSDRDGPPLILISVHPKQRAFGAHLKVMLEVTGYEVWCSIDMCEAESEPVFGNTSPDTLGLDSQDSQEETSAGSPQCDCCESGGPCMSLSQFSRLSQDTNILQDKRLVFQEKADEAGVILFVLSKDFAASKICQQHVYYCEHRKRVIPIRYEEFCMPGWMSMLIGTGPLEEAQAEGYEDLLLARIKRSLDPTARTSLPEEVSEDKISLQVRKLLQVMPKSLSVYVAGGTQFYHKGSEKICRAIGRELAHLDHVLVITGGFLGVGNTVGNSYHQERILLGRQSNMWHVLPERDSMDRSHKARQNKDKTFQMVSYGKTVFSGNSVREREVIVSRAFDICILVEGGPGAAHEAEQFAWCDRVVIPIMSTGGAACGKFNVPQQIFKVPPGVSEEDWAMLGNKRASPDQIGESVARIVSNIKERLKLDAPHNSHSGPTNSPHRKSTRTLQRKSSKLSKMKTLVYHRNSKS